MGGNARGDGGTEFRSLGVSDTTGNEPNEWMRLRDGFNAGRSASAGRWTTKPTGGDSITFDRATHWEALRLEPIDEGKSSFRRQPQFEGGVAIEIANDAAGIKRGKSIVQIFRKILCGDRALHLASRRYGA